MKLERKKSVSEIFFSGLTSAENFALVEMGGRMEGSRLLSWVFGLDDCKPRLNIQKDEQIWGQKNR